MGDLESYKVVVEIFKGYLDTAITANVWFYTITGAIVANYITKREEKPFLKYSLFVPLFFGALLMAMSFIGIFQALELKKKVLEVSGLVGVRGTPPIDTLVIFLGAAGTLSALVGLGLISLFTWKPAYLYRQKQDVITAPASNDKVPAERRGEEIPALNPQTNGHADIPVGAARPGRNPVKEL